jgi:plasminogen activator
MHCGVLYSVLCILAAAAGATEAFAGPAANDAPAAQWQRGGVALEASLGVMNGEANEYVYNPDGSTLSRLIWTFDDVIVLNAGLAVTPWPWLTVGARGRINVTEDSTMDDFDYGIFGCPGLLCHSHHESTNLRELTSLDAYVAATVLAHEHATLKLLAGYKRDSQSWQAYGGTANYTVLPPGLGISYEQLWRAPYIGVSFDGSWERWELGARVIGSWWAQGEDLDNHHLRGLLFADAFGRSEMIGVNAHLGYLVNANVSLKAEYDMQRWDVAKGPTYIKDYVFAQGFFIPGDAAGGDSESHTVSVGVNVNY